MVKLSKSQTRREAELLTICKGKQGEYLSAGHGRGSWATTYSNEFIEASRELWDLYKAAGAVFPEFALSKNFQAAGIRSCRGASMTVERVKYLYKAHLKK